MMVEESCCSADKEEKGTVRVEQGEAADVEEGNLQDDEVERDRTDGQMGERRRSLYRRKRMRQQQ